MGFTAMQTAVGLTASVVAGGSIATAVATTGTESAGQIDQAITSTIENLYGTFMIKSDVTGQASTTGARGATGQIVFNVGLVLDDGRMDFTPPAADPNNNGLAGPDSSNSIIISYRDANQRVDNLYWTVRPLGRNNGDYVLEGGELFQIMIGNSTPGEKGGNLVNALNPVLSTNTRFVLEIMHAKSPGFTFEYTTPGSLSKIFTLR